MHGPSSISFVEFQLEPIRQQILKQHMEIVKAVGTVRRFNIVAAGIEPVRPARDLPDWNRPKLDGSPSRGDMNQGGKLDQIRYEAAGGSLTDLAPSILSRR